MTSTYITPISEYIHLQEWYTLLKTVEHQHRLALLKCHEYQQPDKYQPIFSSITVKKSLCMKMIAQLNHINN